MTVVLIGLGGIWVGGTLGMILGGTLARAKSHDLDSAYTRLSLAVHEYLEACARQSNAPGPDEWIVLRRIVAETDSLAGLEQEVVLPAALASSAARQTAQRNS
jgi:hypothetical protein